MEYNAYEKGLYELGKGFELGLISYESLTDVEKCDLSKYFALKNESLDHQICQTEASLTNMSNRLDDIYKDLLSMK